MIFNIILYEEFSLKLYDIFQYFLKPDKITATLDIDLRAFVRTYRQQLFHNSFPKCGMGKSLQGMV
jgi:hypothetical protein